MPLLDQVTPYARFLAALLAGTAACLFLGAVAFIHKRRLVRIPIRIHVAGTRGKSTVTRLVTAGLRAGGYRVVAKTTGTQPQLILLDGTESSIRRWGAPAIREQLNFIASASRHKADAVVVEAMAIEPEYLGALERFYIKATDLLITNVRPDHQEQIGENPDAMALAIARALPPGGRVFVTMEAATPPLREQSQALGCQFSVVSESNDPDPEHANITLARAICRQHGVDDAAAMAAMRNVQRDIGAFSLQPLHIGGRSISFANAFSCNDVESFRRMWCYHQPASRRAAFLFNARADRPLRSRLFFNLLAQLSPKAPLFITQGSGAMQRWAVAAGFAAEHIHILPRGSAQLQLDRMARDLADGTVVWGTGNFQGAGAEITAFVNAAARSC